MPDRKKPEMPSAPLLTVDEVRAIGESVRTFPTGPSPAQIELRSHIETLVQLAIDCPIGWCDGELLVHRSTKVADVVLWISQLKEHAQAIRDAQDVNIDELIANSSLGKGLANIRDNGLDAELADLDEDLRRAEAAGVLPQTCDCGREQWPHERIPDCLDHEIMMREVSKGKPDDEPLPE